MQLPRLDRPLRFNLRLNSPRQTGTGSSTHLEVMRTATWSTDGKSGRLEYLLHWLCKRCPDVVARQKILAPEERIPTMVLEWARYLIGVYRQGSMDGVAILRRCAIPRPRGVQKGLRGEEHMARGC